MMNLNAPKFQEQHCSSTQHAARSWVHKANKLSPAGSLEGAVRAFYGPWDSGVKSSFN
jgi:hypothetical protein